MSEPDEKPAGVLSLWTTGLILSSDLKHNECPPSFRSASIYTPFALSSRCVSTSDKRQTAFVGQLESQETHEDFYDANELAETSQNKSEADCPKLIRR